MRFVSRVHGEGANQLEQVGFLPQLLSRRHPQLQAYRGIQKRKFQSAEGSRPRIGEGQAIVFGMYMLQGPRERATPYCVIVSSATWDTQMLKAWTQSTMIFPLYQICTYCVFIGRPAVSFDVVRIWADMTRPLSVYLGYWTVSV